MSDSGNIPPQDSQAPALRLVGEDPGPIPFPSAATSTQHTKNEQHDRLLHELGNLLDGSLRNVGLAISKLDEQADDSAPQPAARECLRTADLSLQHMAGLLRQWMRTGSADVGTTYRNDATLQEITRHALRIMSPVADTHRIELTIDLAPQSLEFPAGKLYPVIINGLRNAVEAVGTGGVVTMTTELTEDQLEIRITDNGPGINPQLPRDADGLVQPGVTTKSHGQGLGLAISRDIVRALGGSIRLDNAQPEGTVLRIQLPTPHPNDPNPAI